MENLIEDFDKAARYLKQAEAAFEYADESNFDEINRNLTYAREKFRLAHKMIKESGQFAEFESTFRKKAWENIISGIEFCNRTV
jgi:hypothetical protein